jgi:hypothetical protein
MPEDADIADTAEDKFIIAGFELTAGLSLSEQAHKEIIKANIAKVRM